MRCSRFIAGFLAALSAFAVACSAAATEPPADSPTEPVSPTNTTAPAADPTSTPSDVVRPTPTPTPPEAVTFSHHAGEHFGALTITLASGDAESIRYTLDGSDPNGSGALTYGDEIELLGPVTVRAVAVGANGAVSAESSARFDVTLAKLDQPRLNTGGGVFGEPRTVSIESGEPGATVYYTLDGTTPSASNGIAYSEPLTISETARLQAVNVRHGMIDSDVIGASFRIFGELVEQTGDIVLNGDEQLVIEDTLFLHEGNITLNDNAQLIVRNSFVRHVKEFAFQNGVLARDNSKIVLENSAVGSNCTGSFNYTMHGNSSLEADGVDIGEGSCNVWVFMGGDTLIDVDGWDGFGGTVCDGSSVEIENSETLEVEFCFPEGSTIDTSLPTDIETYAFGPEPSNGVEFSLQMRNVVMDGWGINVLPRSNITIGDSAAITIGVIAGLPWDNETVTLDGLQRTLYEQKTWQIGPDASLTLINTNVYGWEPNAFAQNTMVIKNSDYSASAVNSGDGHYDISDSIVDLISANERVTMTITNTVITGDVVANDDTVIVLIDSEVRGTIHGDDGLFGGNVFARGNGRVILRNTTVAGEMVEQGNGEIVVE